MAGIIKPLYDSLITRLSSSASYSPAKPTFSQNNNFYPGDNMVPMSNTQHTTEPTSQGSLIRIPDSNDSNSNPDSTACANSKNSSYFKAPEENRQCSNHSHQNKCRVTYNIFNSRYAFGAYQKLPRPNGVMFLLLASLGLGFMGYHGVDEWKKKQEQESDD